MTKKAPKTILKINARTVIGTKEVIKSLVDDADGEVHIMNVFGVVTGAKTVTGGNFGDSVMFTGSFGAVNKVTGEMFRASKLFLPGMASEIVENQFTGEPLDIDVDIAAIPNDKDPGFAYIAEAGGEDVLAAKFANKMG